MVDGKVTASFGDAFIRGNNGEFLWKFFVPNLVHLYSFGTSPVYLGNGGHLECCVRACIDHHQPDVQYGKQQTFANERDLSPDRANVLRHGVICHLERRRQRFEDRYAGDAWSCLAQSSALVYAVPLGLGSLLPAMTFCRSRSTNPVNSQTWPSVVFGNYPILGVILASWHNLQS
jgi:hypothetical protein